MARHELDGTNRTSLFIPSEPQKISDIAVSADGKLVAITSNCGSSCREQNLVSFVDVAKATVVSQVRQDDQRFTAFRGDVWQLVWRADGSGVFVSGATYSEQPGGRATVRVDGSVTVHPEVSGFLTVSPNGKLMAEGSPQLPCERVGGRSFAVTELDTGNLVAVADGEKGAYAAWEWSPDSSQVVYQFLPGDTATCDWAEGRQMEVRLIDLDAGTGEKVPNLRDLHLRWYGERFVEAVCKEARPEEPVRNRWGDTNAICKAPESGEQLGDLFLGGSRIANWPNLGSQFIGLGIEPVGFLTKAP